MCYVMIGTALSTMVPFIVSYGPTENWDEFQQSFEWMSVQVAHNISEQRSLWPKSSSWSTRWMMLPSVSATLSFPWKPDDHAGDEASSTWSRHCMACAGSALQNWLACLYYSMQLLRLGMPWTQSQDNQMKHSLHCRSRTGLLLDAWNCLSTWHLRNR